MVGSNLKGETLNLMGKRSAIEAEMNSIIEVLRQPGGPGLSGNLLDSEGFPRADIDVPMVLAQRNRLALLKNDHKELTEKIDVNIQVLHSAKLSQETSQKGSVDGISNYQGASVTGTTARSSTVPDAMDFVTNIPFAMVDEIADASPAAEDGLQLGDQIVKFGNVKAGDNLLQQLVYEAQANQGCAVPTFVMRQGALINLTVTPRSWRGRGLLGCHFRIM